MLNMDIAGKRILEVGCGIGLPSLMLSMRGADITAIDHHPCAEEFLERNSQLNDSSPIPFFCSSWADLDSEIGLFDMIIGSDLLYEREHVDQLSAFIDCYSRAESKTIIVDPGRFLHSRFSHEMTTLGFSLAQSKPEAGPYLDRPFKGKILTYERTIPPRFVT